MVELVLIHSLSDLLSSVAIRTVVARRDGTVRIAAIPPRTTPRAYVSVLDGGWFVELCHSFPPKGKGAAVTGAPM